MFRRLFFAVCIFAPSVSIAQPYDGCGTGYDTVDEAQLNCLRRTADLLASIDAIERALILQISSINQDTSSLAALTANGQFPVDNTESHAKLDSLTALLTQQRDLLTEISQQIVAVSYPPKYVSTLLSLDSITSCKDLVDGQSEDDCLAEALESMSSAFCSVQPSSTGTFSVIPEISHAVLSCASE